MACCLKNKFSLFRSEEGLLSGSITPHLQLFHFFKIAFTLKMLFDSPSF